MKTPLPAEGSTVTAICGCVGEVLSLHGNAVHVRVLDPCPTGHPERITSSVVEHFLPEEIQRTVQLVLDLSPTPGMETRAA